MLESYIYSNLKNYKNAVIDNAVYKKLGEKKILADLKAHGFDCQIRTTYIKITDGNFRFSERNKSPKYSKKQFEETYIIEEVNNCG